MLSVASIWKCFNNNQTSQLCATLFLTYSNRKMKKLYVHIQKMQQSPGNFPNDWQSSDLKL